MTDRPPLSCGRIAYTNDLPLFAAFDAGAVVFPGILQTQVPAELNALMLEAKLDISPISAFAYLAHSNRYALLPDICIGSRNEVWSVLVVSETPLHELDHQEIVVTGESASGRNLLRVLLERYYGVEAAVFTASEDPYRVATTGKPVLLIGDAAINARANLPPEWIHDLGQIWHRWTGLDMVYAVWAVQRELVTTHAAPIQAILNAFREAKVWWQSHQPEVIASAQHMHARPAGFYEAYYATLNFQLDDGALAGLKRFADELVAISAIPPSPNLVPEVLACHSQA